MYILFAGISSRHVRTGGKEDSTSRMVQVVVDMHAYEYGKPATSCQHTILSSLFTAKSHTKPQDILCTGKLLQFTTGMTSFLNNSMVIAGWLQSSDSPKCLFARAPHSLLYIVSLNLPTRVTLHFQSKPCSQLFCNI